MPKLPTQCPACSEHLEVVRLACPTCAMSLEGHFELPEILHLSREDLEFALQFIRCSGNLKELSLLRGQSYPTLRNRLDGIIQTLSPRPDKAAAKRRRKMKEAVR